MKSNIKIMIVHEAENKVKLILENHSLYILVRALIKNEDVIY